MNISAVITDSIKYPFHNIKAFVTLTVLGIIGGIVGGSSLYALSVSSFAKDGLPFEGTAIIGFIILILISLLIQGYMIDIVKYAIFRRDDSPKLEISRQISNGIKFIIVGIVYYLLPFIIITVIQIFLKNWFTSLIGFILLLLFAFGELMAKCNLAKTDSLNKSLAFGKCIRDISKIGMIKILAVIIIILVLFGVLNLILMFVYEYNTVIGGILFGLLGVYTVFLYNRALGLLYSDE